MDKYPLIHCDFEDEQCCHTCKQVSVTNYYRAVEGTNFCPRHGGPRQLERNKVATANAYRLQIWQNRLREMTGYDQVKVLREEIGILRVVLEEGLKKYQDTEGLLMFSAKAESLITTISKLVTSCERLERNMGEMMDRPTTMKFASKIIEIIGRYIEDTEILDGISGEILEEMR